MVEANSASDAKNASHASEASNARIYFPFTFAKVSTTVIHV